LLAVGFDFPTQEWFYQVQLFFSCWLLIDVFR
jgi:hypothetical protein